VAIVLILIIIQLRHFYAACNSSSVCWNDAFIRIFHYKRFESVKCLQDAFGVMYINRMYDLYRWNVFFKSLHWCKAGVIAG